jgi:hypothetical protein
MYAVAEAAPEPAPAAVNVTEYNPGTSGVIVTVPENDVGVAVIATAPEDAVNANPVAVLVRTAVVAVVAEPSRSAIVTNEPVGTEIESVPGFVSLFAIVDPTVVVTAVPTVAACDAVPTTAAEEADCAGTTDKSPNPSEATATTATFFNEIVFTIFLSFSQIKDDLLSGW